MYSCAGKNSQLPGCKFHCISKIMTSIHALGKVMCKSLGSRGTKSRNNGCIKQEVSHFFLARKLTKNEVIFCQRNGMHYVQNRNQYKIVQLKMLSHTVNAWKTKAGILFNNQNIQWWSIILSQNMIFITVLTLVERI